MDRESAQLHAQWVTIAVSCRTKSDPVFGGAVFPSVVAIDKTLRDLEFDRVKSIVRQHASCSLGEEAVDALVPISDAQAIASAMDEIREAMRFLSVHGRFSLGGVRDLAPLVTRARESSALNGEAFAVIAATIEGTLQVRETLIENAEGPLLSRIAERLTAGGPSIRRNIHQAIDERGGIRDDATPELSQLTRKRRTIEGRIESKLQHFIDRNPELISEPVISRRRGRLVISIRSGAVGSMEFIVHDRSATGQTLYVEPPGFVPENNQVSQLDNDIREEIRRILRALTHEFLEAETAFLRDRAILSHLDSSFARADYAIQARCDFPEIGSVIKLRQARHPLIDADAVVPVTLSLGERSRMMVLTGPNTGGKTVSLKTIGLLALMTQAAIPIPASPDSELPLFRSIRTDIGDEQSISQNLSTFSAHMTNIVSVLADADVDTLVLLDELGAGTDPQEGAALGLSVIEALLESNALVFVSTHLTPLKYFAIRHPEVKTASMEFDIKTLSPTFRVVEGVPGRSNAFIIAQRLGFPLERIERARSFLSQGEIRAEDILDELERERQAMRAQRQAADHDRSEATALRETYERRLIAFEQEKEAALSDRFRALDVFLRDSQRRLETLLASTQHSESDDARREHLREISQLREETRKRQEEAQQLRHSDSLSTDELEIGKTVHVRSLASDGRIVQLTPKGKVTIDMDGIRVQTVPTDLIAPRNRSNKTNLSPKKRVQPHPKRLQGKQIPLELNVMGLTVNEALRLVEEYLDQLLLADIRKARILHGKGTGALRDAVQSYLGSCRFVASYGFAPPNLGGDGVTELEIAESS
ncbi:endonuclease MutS2 [Candidatus Bipolaricaulota bacterium]|nr:endonuclease MutS2 [Candidatus Bipolaricaulota bacterium]